MNAKKLVIYYLTEDLNNHKENNELTFLRQLAKVVVITDRPGVTHPLGMRTLSVQPRSELAKKIFGVWSRLCLMLGQLGNSAMDQRFPERNIYVSSSVARVINLLWRIKNIAWLNRQLPSYDTLYFAPLNCAPLSCVKRRDPVQRRIQRLFVHDALLVRLNSFATLIASVRAAGDKTLAIVKSWDNPFYSQLATEADGFLVWSPSMWRDVERTHGLSCDFVHAWGARPFFEMVQARQRHQAKSAGASKSGRFVVGYAAAFGDESMGRHEIDLIKTLSAQLQALLPNCLLRLRPYPTFGNAFYAELEALPNVEVVPIGGEATDRYGDAREFIRFGSNEERLDYLSTCNVFLSLATSFTIEAAIFRLPILHFYLPTAERRTRSEHEIFRRIDICDHLGEYFAEVLEVAQSHADVARCLAEIIVNPESHLKRSAALLNRLGVPEVHDMPLRPSQAFELRLRKWLAA
jgi:hypothetical protein